MNFKHTMLAAALLASGAAHASSWSTFDNLAIMSHEDSGINVFVGFPTHSKCNNAILGIGGADEISYIAATVGKHEFAPVEASMTDGIAMVGLSDNALRAIKHGNKLEIYTDQGYLVVSLRGSARAINEAYADCMSQIGNPALKPLQASGRVSL
jgi:hypothetical protein